MIRVKVEGVLLAAAIALMQGPIPVLAQVFCDGGGNPSNSPDLSDPKIYTALGCVPAKLDGFVTWLLPYLFGIAGGIAFLKMVNGFIGITMSGGDPKAVAAAQENITSAIYGLLVVIFSLLILRLIAVGILRIPGLN